MNPSVGTTNFLGISWQDPRWVPILNKDNVLDYFSERSNPFYNRACNNETIKMQRLSLQHLENMTGLEYILLHHQDPVLFVIRKQHRQSPKQVTTLADYYIIAGTVYQAPDLGSVINSRLMTTLHHMESAFTKTLSFATYHPAKGYSWNFKDQEDQQQASIKPKKKKKKEEPASAFQYSRVDGILSGLVRKFPPKYAKDESSERPIAVPESKSDTTGSGGDNNQQEDFKPPPEKRIKFA